MPVPPLRTVTEVLFLKNYTQGASIAPGTELDNKIVDFEIIP